MSFFVIPEVNEYNEITKREMNEEMKKKFNELVEKCKQEQKTYQENKPILSEEDKKELIERANFLLDTMLSAWADSSLPEYEYSIDYTKEKFSMKLSQQVSLGLMRRGFNTDSQWENETCKYTICFDVDDCRMCKVEKNENLPKVHEKIEKLLEERKKRKQEIEDYSMLTVLNEWLFNGQQPVKASEYDEDFCVAVASRLSDYDEETKNLWCNYSLSKHEFNLKIQNVLK